MTTGYEPHLYEESPDVWRTHADKDDEIEIYDLTDYTFTVSGPISDSQTMQNRNSFKKIRGIAGLIQVDGEAVPDVEVTIIGKDGVLAVVTTDEDGFYGYQFHHKGKKFRYIVITDGYGSDSVFLKAGRFAEVNFIITS
jgi:hypothetical protein